MSDGLKLKQRVKSGELSPQQALSMLEQRGQGDWSNTHTARWLRSDIAEKRFREARKKEA